MALTLNNGIKKWIRWLKNDSIQSLKQVTNPDQDFVIDRLQRIDAITEIEVVINLKVIH